MNSTRRGGSCSVYPGSEFRNSALCLQSELRRYSVQCVYCSVRVESVNIIFLLNRPCHYAVGYLPAGHCGCLVSIPGQYIDILFRRERH